MSINDLLKPGIFIETICQFNLRSTPEPFTDRGIREFRISEKFLVLTEVRRFTYFDILLGKIQVCEFQILSKDKIEVLYFSECSPIEQECQNFMKEVT
jgi:hypothetical protein